MEQTCTHIEIYIETRNIKTNNNCLKVMKSSQLVQNYENVFLFAHLGRDEKNLDSASKALIITMVMYSDFSIRKEVKDQKRCLLRRETTHNCEQSARMHPPTHTQIQICPVFSLSLRVVVKLSLDYYR